MGASAQYRGAEMASANPSKPFAGLKKDLAYNVDFQSNLAEKFGNFNASGAYQNFFNLTGVATTPIGKITGWFGDLIYPVAIGGVIFFGAYILLNIAFQVSILYTKINDSSLRHPR